MTHGAHYRSLLSTSTLIRIIDTLLNTDCFDEHDQAYQFALELHLRCVVAALRSLTLYGSYSRSRYLTFDLLENLYNSLSKWAQYHSIQSQKGLRPRPSDFLENYNNEFLIVYARDLLCSVSWDRDLMIQSVSRISEGIKGVEGDNPSLAAVKAHQRKLSPSKWHQQYRDIEKFFLNMRLYCECNELRSEAKGLVKEAVEGLEKFWTDSEQYLLNTFETCIKKDIEESNAIEDKPEEGTLADLAIEASYNDDVIEVPPIARTGHFTYALLDLIQQHRTLLQLPFSKLVDLLLDVAKTSNHSFLRSKALEVLLAIGRLERIGIPIMENELQKRAGGSPQFRRATFQWRHVKKRGEEAAGFLAQLSPVTVFLPPLKDQVLPLSITNAAGWSNYQT